MWASLFCFAADGLEFHDRSTVWNSQAGLHPGVQTGRPDRAYSTGGRTGARLIFLQLSSRYLWPSSFARTHNPSEGELMPCPLSRISRARRVQSGSRRARTGDARGLFHPDQRRLTARRLPYRHVAPGNAPQRAHHLPASQAAPQGIARAGRGLLDHPDVAVRLCLASRRSNGSA